jgi:hypothetical protein
MLPAHEEILSIQLVTNNKYARQVRSCAAGFTGLQKLLQICLQSVNKLCSHCLFPVVVGTTLQQVW